jgi:sulfide:quinone oxidoreductase
MSARQKHPILIVGGGAAGISVAASLLKRNSSLKISIIEPAESHYYQPGWTMVGAGIFNVEETRRDTAQVMPNKVNWIKSSVTFFQPEENTVSLADGMVIAYDRLIVCPGIKLDWDAVEGLSENLGKNGVTSNYSSTHSLYTWELVQGLKSGRALFTQPPMPIKCAGAPQKALYLSADHWKRNGVIKDIEISFYNAVGVLFGVGDYVPALMKYMDGYGANIRFSHNLISIDGEAKIATFKQTDAEGATSLVTSTFGMIHVCPPQKAPDFIRNSPLSNDAGWVDVDQHTLRHSKYNNIWSLGDVMSAPNAKTAAAVRKQAPIVAANIIEDLSSSSKVYGYDGYGACPLTVERGKIVLAEFGYGGALKPTLPTWLLKGTSPTSLAWFLKKSVMPKLYWDWMLKGKELLVKPSELKQ